VLAGDLSRNRTVGLRLGAGEKLADITASMGGAVAEGVLTSSAAHALGKKLGVEVPIIDGLFAILHGQAARAIHGTAAGRRWLVRAPRCWVRVADCAVWLLRPAHAEPAACPARPCAARTHARPQRAPTRGLSWTTS
jgi:hypothetical protein